MTKYEGGGVTLAWDNSGGTSFTDIGQVVDYGGPTLGRNSIDSTTRDDTNKWRTFIKGWKDAGELTFGVALDPALASHSTAAGFLGDFLDDSTIPNWQITFPDSTTWECLGFLTGSEPTGPLDDLLTADVSIKLSGEPTLA